MMPRVLAVLLLCLSSGMAASLFIATVEVPETEPPVVVDIPADDPLAVEPPVVVDIPADDPLAVEPPAADTLASDPPIDDALVVDTAVVQEPAVEAPAEGTPIAEAPAEDSPDAGTPADETATTEAPADEAQEPGTISAEEDESSWGFNSIRDSFQSTNGYLDSLVELMGGHNGVCQYRCRFGKIPQPRLDYEVPAPNGCSSPLLGFEFDMGIPAMTKCCNQLDMCYDTCGSHKPHCDSKFRWCLHGICADLKRSLGLVSKVEACKSLADALYNTVWTLGCRPYMNSQRAACYCEGDKDEL